MLMLRTLGDEYNKCYLSQYEAVPQKLEWRYKEKGRKTQITIITFKMVFKIGEA